MKPTIGRIVIYHHPGSADGKYPATDSPAIIRAVKILEHYDSKEGKPFNQTECQLFVFGPKGQHQDWATEGTGPSQWSWPERV